MTTTSQYILALACAIVGFCFDGVLFAATAANAYVTVSSSTSGVEDIVPVGADFYITTRNVSKPSFRADITVAANSPYYLVKPADRKMNLGIGEKDEYKVKDESGNEDEFSGKVHVLKLDIEPTETNVCWKSTSCTLKLTDDSYPGGTAEWTSSPAGISGRGNSITFSPNSLTAGVYTVTARSGIVSSYTDTCIVRVVKIEFITPDGDPVLSPVDSGDGQNEFTFSGANPGILTMDLKAKVIPASAASAITGCQFNVGDIGSSVKNWAVNNPNGKATVSGGYLTATVTFTGLPEHNSDFGKKTATVSWNGVICDTNDYEVFFPRDSRNKDASMPNWFYYWRVITTGNLVYSGASGSSMMAEVRGMTQWTYQIVPDKTHIYIYDETICKCQPYGVGEEMSGIDMFIGTVIHENKHIQQIRNADSLLESSSRGCFRYGWSWNQSPHNHWGKGQDGRWGVALRDDDGNGIVDDATICPPFEPGHGDDTLLEHVSYDHWPSIWPLPVPMFPGIHPIECEAINATDGAINENDYSIQDWASPGKQHQTLNDWSD